MKRYLLLFVFALGIATASFSQKEKEEKEEKAKASITPPAVVKAAFEKAFKGAAKIKWGKEKDGGYEVNFMQSGKEMAATYNAKGTLVETEWEIKPTELPAVIVDYVKKNYKGAKIAEAAKIVKANGEVNYEAEVKGMDLIFDANGKFLKSVKE